MSGNSATSGFTPISQGLRRLQGTEVSLADLPGVFAGWWRRFSASAAALLERLTPRLLLTDDPHLQIAITAPGRADLTIRRNSAIVAEAAVEFDQPHSLAAQLADSHARLPACAIISVAEGAALLKRVPVSPSVRGRKLAAALDYMLEVESPFPRDQVLWAYRLSSDIRQGQRLVDLVIVPRSVVDPVVSAAKSSGTHVREIRYQPSLAPDAVIRIAAFHTPAGRRQRRVCMVLGALAFIEIAALATAPFVANAIRSEHMTEKTEQLNRIATDLAQERAEFAKVIQPIERAFADLQGLPSPVGVLEALQKELGQDVVLDRLSLRGRSIQLSGSTDDLSGIVNRLEKSPSLKPRSVTSNGKIGAQQLERFSLSLELAANP